MILERFPDPQKYELPEPLQTFFDVDAIQGTPGNKMVYHLQPLSEAAKTALERAIRNQRYGFIHPDEHILIGVDSPDHFDPRTWLSWKAFSNVVTELISPYNQFDVTVNRNKKGLPSQINTLLL